MGTDGKVWIVGAGGVGCVLGARLERACPGEVVLLDCWTEHVETIRSDGLTLDCPEGTFTVRPSALTLDRIVELDGAPDLVVLAVKAYDTAETIATIEPYIGTAPVLSLQNSINEELIAERVGAHRTLGGVCLYSAALSAPGRATEAMAGGKIVIGELDGTRGARIESVAELLRLSVPVELSDNIWGDLWTKLIRNAMVNGIAAAVDLGMGDLVLVPGADRVCIGLGSEAIRVALRLGHDDLHAADLFDCGECPIEWFLAPIASDERNRLEQAFRDRWIPYPGVYPSLLQDLRKKRRTEIEALNGYIASKGRALCIATPLNRALTELVLDCSATARFGDPVPTLAALLPLVA